MTAKEAVNWIINISADIGKREHKDLWHYEQALSEIKEMLESAEFPDINDGDVISRKAAIDYFVTNVGFHDEDGYPIDDSDELRKIWTEYFDGIPSAQPEITRCKDCRHNNDCEIQYSAQSGDEFFCGCAERKDNG